MLGIFRAPDRLTPTDRRAKAEWLHSARRKRCGADTGEIVLAEPLPSGGRYGLKPARVVERLGRMGDARSVSLICIHTHDIPHEFPAGSAGRGRKRPRQPRSASAPICATSPLVTIDGEDARDFDDAVYAEPDGDGFRLIVAIADVAHYVRPGFGAGPGGAARAAIRCYFPDRVVPMLPEALSNGWCSLRPERGSRLPVRRDAHRRATAANGAPFRPRPDAQRRAADLRRRCSSAHDAGEATAGVPDGCSAPLYAAFRALLAARTRAARSISTCPSAR